MTKSALGPHGKWTKNAQFFANTAPTFFNKLIYVLLICRYEQDGDQSFGQAIRDIRCCNYHQRKWHSSPCCKDGSHGSQDARTRMWWRIQLRYKPSRWIDAARLETHSNGSASIRDPDWLRKGGLKGVRRAREPNVLHLEEPRGPRWGSEMHEGIDLS